MFVQFMHFASSLCIYITFHDLNHDHVKLSKDFISINVTQPLMKATFPLTEIDELPIEIPFRTDLNIINQRLNANGTNHKVQSQLINY